MTDKTIGHHRVLKITRLIDQQIVKRAELLHTMVSLKKSVEQRMFNGQLKESDLHFIKRKLKDLK
jgi:hypothetical protein